MNFLFNKLYDTIHLSTAVDSVLIHKSWRKHFMLNFLNNYSAMIQDFLPRTKKKKKYNSKLYIYGKTK